MNTKKIERSRDVALKALEETKGLSLHLNAIVYRADQILEDLEHPQGTREENEALINKYCWEVVKKVEEVKRLCEILV